MVRGQARRLVASKGSTLTFVVGVARSSARERIQKYDDHRTGGFEAAQWWRKVAKFYARSGTRSAAPLRVRATQAPVLAPLRGIGTRRFESSRPSDLNVAEGHHADRGSKSNSRRPTMGMFASTSPAPAGDAIRWH